MGDKRSERMLEELLRLPGNGKYPTLDHGGAECRHMRGLSCAGTPVGVCQPWDLSLCRMCEYTS